MLQSYSICLRISIANRDYPLIHYPLPAEFADPNLESEL